MTDTRAAPNIIKSKVLHPETKINACDVIVLNEITDGSIKTIGSVTIKQMGHNIPDITIHVIAETKPENTDSRSYLVDTII